MLDLGLLSSRMVIQTILVVSLQFTSAENQKWDESDFLGAVSSFCATFGLFWPD